MIDEEETFKRFGYRSKDLKPKSGKKIVAVCDICGKVREVVKADYCVLCRPCSDKSDERKRKISEGRKGKHHSEETRKKIGEAQKGEKSYYYGKHLSEETIRKISETLKGEKNPNYGKHLSDEQRRKLSEVHKGIQAGENNPAWKGGISFEPYCVLFNREFKERIREFWGRKCGLCGDPENGRKLDVHHVSYNKGTCCDDSIPLFIPLCKSCHSKTQSDRKYYENEFKRIIYSKSIDGKCYYSKEEMKEEKRK